MSDTSRGTPHPMSAPAEPDALAATKFTPPRVPVGWVHRPRLDTRLEAGLQGPLTLLAAGAGAGKSAMLGAWAARRECSGPVAWLSLDPGDRDRPRFWRGVLGALAAAGAPAPVAALTVHPPEHVELLIPALVNALVELDEPVVLVLDDLHEVGDGGVLADLDRLLRHAPVALRLVISTRVDPPLRVGRLRLAGALTELREADLAFTEHEAAALLDAAGIDLAPDDVRQLWLRTEGWAAGLRLAALTLRTHPDPSRFVSAFAGDDAAMADYLLNEVLAQQPEALVDFLLRTSVVDVVCGELADALTGGVRSDEVLARLEREHALVSAHGDQRTWHRYHPLLRELLRSELRYRAPEQVPELHRRAAAWYVAQRRPVEALRHAAEAGDWDTVAALAGRHWIPLLVRGELSTLRTALESLPSARRGHDPEVALALSAVLLDQGDEAAAAELLERATAASAQVPHERQVAFRLGLAAVGLVRARLRGDLDGALSAVRSLLGAPRDAIARLQPGALDLRALALVNLGIAELWTGELDAARRDLEAGRRAAADHGLEWLALLATAHLATHAMFVVRLERARRFAEETLALADARGWSRTWPAGLAEATLSAIALERNRLTEANAHFARAEELLAQASDAPLRMAALVHRARLLVASGRAESALEALEAAREAGAGWPVAPALRGLVNALEALARASQGQPHDAELALGQVDGRPATSIDAAAQARLRLLTNDLDAVHDVVRPWLDDGVPVFGSVLTELWLLDALAHDAAAAHEPAADSLEHALDAAEPSGIHRPFAMGTDGSVVPLLRRQLRRGTAHRSLVEDLLRDLARPGGDGDGHALLLERLSDRETAVLRFLPTMMSNQEIASELFVSVNTVKTHLKAIYRKLDVADRRGAVRRARELELLAP